VGLGVLVEGGRCLLGKTAQSSSVSSIKVRHYFELTARSRNSVVGICLETINYNNLGRVFEHGPYFYRLTAIPGNAAAKTPPGGDPHLA
jgi:hypothetical protein